MAEKADPKITGKPKDVVSEDRNWVLRINNQMNSEKVWDNQWGYMSGGFSPQKAQIKPDIQSKIQELEDQIKHLDTNIYQKSSNSYGKQGKVQLFPNNKNNITKSGDLRALERRLPKNWKKQKWTPPVDPFDPLSKKK